MSMDELKNCKAKDLWIIETGGLLNKEMTIRDFFASQALVGLMSGTYAYGNTVVPELASIKIYEIADAILKAREQNDLGKRCATC